MVGAFVGGMHKWRKGIMKFEWVILGLQDTIEI